jgi:hypothetical protein
MLLAIWALAMPLTAGSALSSSWAALATKNGKGLVFPFSQKSTKNRFLV